MKVRFDHKDRHKILADIHTAMGDRKLGEMVTFNLAPGALEITISKLGTSTIIFGETETSQGLEYAIKEEKIAFTHRGFKDEVKEKIMRCVQKAGGQVLA